MKINCKNCGKRFNHERHGGTCPKCGTVQTVGQYASSMSFNEKAVYTHDTNDDATGSHSASPKESETYNTIQSSADTGNKCTQTKPAKQNSSTASSNRTKTKSEPRKKTNPVVTAILLTTMILTAVIPIVACHFVNQINADKQTMEIFPETEVYALNEPIPSSNEDITLTITKAVIDTNEKLVAPNGYEFLSISYHIENKTNPDITYAPYEIASGIKPYLVTQDGSYLCPLAAYSLRNALELEYEEAKELGISDSFSSPNGVLYFLVKENDALSLRLNYHHADSLDYDAVHTLERILEIQDLEVER